MVAALPPETAAPADPLRSIALHGPDGFPGGPAAFARRLRRPVWEGTTEDEHVAVLFHRPETMRNATLWAKPFTAWIELAGLGDTRLASLLDRAASADIFASITTATAHDLQLAHRVVEALREDGRVGEPAASDIEFALHEAVSNALLHGNLELESMKGLSLGDLNRFSDEFASRLKDPVLAARRVEVLIRTAGSTAMVEVSDEGSGFNPRPRQAGCGTSCGATGPTPLPQSAHGASGRGLDLIAGIATTLELLDGGRRIRMEFVL